MKNLLFTTTMLLIAASSIAQLYVKPTTVGSNPSYIYAKNVQLYVEGTIGLEKNPLGDYEGSIYLRDEAQLFQGEASTYNSGDGILSVYQTANGDQYDYNFFASPVGTPSGSIILGGDSNSSGGPGRIEVSNDISAIPTDIGSTNIINNWTGNSTSSSLNISKSWLYKYTSDATGWQAVGNAVSSNSVAPGYGYSMKGVNTSGNTTDPYLDTQFQQYDFRGRPNTGNIEVGVTVEGSTLAGNPYPSAIDLFSFFNDSDNTELTRILFWDENRAIESHYYVNNQGGYGTWIPGVPIPSDPESEYGDYVVAPYLSYDNDGFPIIGSNTGNTTQVGNHYRRRFSPIGQGFILKSDAGEGGTSGSIFFKNSHRVYKKVSSGESIFRQSETSDTDQLKKLAYDNNNQNSDTNQNEDDFSSLSNYSDANYIDANYNNAKIRLSAYFPGSHFRDIIINLSNDATKGFDRGLDAVHPMDATSDAYMPIEDGKKLVIQSIPIDINAIIPITITTDIVGSVVFSVYEEYNLPFDNAYLFDAAQTTFQVITGGNSATVNIEEVGESTNRFYIVFKSQDQVEYETAEKTGLNLAKETVDVFQDNRLSVMEILNPERFDIKEAAVFDMSGKLVHTERNIGDQTRYNFPTTTLSDGVYIVKLTTQDNLLLDYKITIYNKN